MSPAPSLDSVAARSAGPSVWEGLLRLIFPPACAACGVGVPAGDFCERCRKRLLATAGALLCSRCGTGVGPFVDATNGCFACRRERFAFTGVLRLGRYDDALRSACLKMKHERGRRLAVALADLFFEIRTGKIAALGIDAVVPVPLHWKRRAWRGYNQSAEVAERLAHRLRLPFHENLLRRTRPTPVQTNLSATKRRENVRNAFAPRRRLEGATVLLVDDVMTTGATCHYAAKALKEAGASKVIAAILARREDPRVSPALEEP